MSLRTKTLGLLCAACAAGYGYLDQRSEKVLSEVRPTIREVSYCAAKRLHDDKSNISFMAYHGHRTDAEHATMLAKGVSWIKRSKHQDGKAVDVMAKVNGVGTWDHAPYYTIADAFYACGDELKIRIIWGCTWKQKDCVHFEEK